ncbi:hypothetical protein N0V93_008913 [Gnomoniopsis smithogilvyi]|uniref:Carrier domain-containing protein n=1 Tax=Gnomoniopsis smithogilvyi TaxID=1191159 RepID=A0A9W9CT71_9PEZI|nr:hypothetical protein N0V93_008913 [Gnomoniopsis smithogilvyi]
MANAVNRAAHRMVELCGKPEANSFPTLAYIGPNDARYVVSMIASVKAGYQALFISPRNTKEGQLNLFKKTNCNIIAYAGSHKEAVQSWVEEREMHAIEVSPIDEWFPENEIPHFPYNKTFEEGEWDPFSVLHTSGSTGLPKPIIVRQGMVAVADALQGLPKWRDERIATADWAEAKRIFVPMPLFHMAGIIGVIINAFYQNCPVVLGPTDRPMTSDLVIECLDKADVESAMLPPAIIEDLGQSEQGIQALAKLTTVAYGGGNLARECGNRLTKRGARLFNFMGATEFAPFAVYTKKDPMLWQYFHYNKDILACEFRKQDGEEDVYEMIMVRQNENKKHPGLQGVFYTFPDLDEWSTKDLYRPHPELPDHWIYHGRADNIIVFSNGEKLNPVTIEEIISDHAELKGAMVVGSQKFQAGVIVEPKVYPETKEEAKALLDRVWPLVERANEETVQHGRISRDLVVLSNPSKPFLRAGKGTIQRAMTVKLYEEDIEKMYENSGATDDEAPKLNIESEETLAQSIVETLQKQLAAKDLDIDVDFFAAGIDSLGVMNAAKILRAGLKDSGYEVDAKALAPKVIYTNSTPRRLATYIFNTVINGNNGTQSEDEQQQEAMAAIHRKYTQNLIKAAPNRPDPRNENQVVVLTGSTGMLGSYLLDLMGRNERVSKIICLNRSADGGRAQQVKALTDRGLDVDVLDTKAEFYQADLSKPDLGLSTEVYQRLLAETDRIIHNAWPVNFNIPIESFEPFLAGVRYVGDLAATASKRVAVTFISSIAVADRWHAEDRGSAKVPEARLEDLSLPGGGYGRSKMVGSLIIEDAAAQSAGDFPYAMVRVGQVAGPQAEQGMWNRQEWLPSIIASSLYLKALPNNLGAMDRVDWTPAEAIAKLILEAAGVTRVLSQANDMNGYYHGVNPHETKWGTLAASVQEFYGEERIKELISFEEWCDRLDKTQVDGEESVARNPGVKLIDSYRGMAAGAGMQPVIYDMAKTLERCSVVQETTAVTPDMMKHWCKQWGL